MSTTDLEIASLRAELEACKKLTASLPPPISSSSSSLSDYWKQIATPLHIIIAVAIPIIMLLILGLFQPSFVKVEDGEEMVVSKWAVVKYSFYGSLIGWMALAAYVGYGIMFK